VKKKSDLDNLDLKFLRSVEGFEIKGYVPKDRDINDKVPSGVTIGTGFDLGQQTLAGFKKFAFSETLYNKLKPYVGLKGVVARDKLALLPLRLTNLEADELDKKVKQGYYTRLVKEYEARSDLTFTTLAVGKQTAIFSVFFQYGSLSRTPRFREAVCKGQWKKAIAELRNFGDNYVKRRNMEADLMEASLTEKERKLS
jgi:hypothetical protein